jgi:uncharacterized protein
MTALALSVLAASLLGSVHCAGMCGGLAGVAAGAGRGRSDVCRAHLGFSAGRLLAYLALGAVAGSLGGLIDLAGHLAGVARAAALLAGLAVMACGTVMLLDARGARRPRLAAPARLTRLLASAGQAATRAALATIAPARHPAREQDRGVVHGDGPYPLRGGRTGPRPASRLLGAPAVRGGGLGLLAACLPCGWLYGFVLAAAATGDPVAGALVMSVFWLGTLPALLLVGLGAAALTGTLRRHAPAAAAVAMVAVGLLTVAGRTTLAGAPRAASPAPAGSPAAPGPHAGH